MELDNKVKVQLPAFKSGVPLSRFLTRVETTVSTYKFGRVLKSFISPKLQRPIPRANNITVPSCLQGEDFESSDDGEDTSTDPSPAESADNGE